MRRVIDISLRVESGMLRYPSDPAFRMEQVKHPDQGDPASVSVYHLGSHTGTHVDPPKHFLPGAGGLETVPIANLVGECVVVDVDGEWITAETLQKRLPKGDRIVLLRTLNSRRGLIRSKVFSEEYAALTLDGARFLRESGVSSVGIDYLSIEKPVTAEQKREFPVHRELLGGGITVLEGLDLTDVSEGRYWLACLPLNVTGSDGGPARAVLVED